MGKHRTAVVLTAITLSLLGVAPAQASHKDHPHKGRAWIQGVVTDQAGHLLDDVNVEAFAKDGDEPVASSLTYEDPDGGQDHGFFRLYVPVGAYTVQLSSTGGQEDGDDYRRAHYDGGATLNVVTMQVKDVGEIALVHAGKVASKTEASLVDTSILTTDNGMVKFDVSSHFVDPVDGTVKVAVDGDRAGSVDLADGAGKLKLDRLSAGTHTLAVSYLGSETVKSSKDSVTLTVKKKPRHHRALARPNAW